MIEKYKKALAKKAIGNLSGLQLLETLICTQFFMDALDGSDRCLTEVVEIMQSDQIGEEDISAFLKLVGKRLNYTRDWTRESLNNFVEEVVEKIKNDLMGMEPNPEAPEVVKLVRSVPIRDVSFPYFMIPYLIFGSFQQYSYMQPPPPNEP